MNYPHYIATWVDLNPKIQYHFIGEYDEWKENYNKVINILLQEPEFHQLLQEHGTTAIIQPDWTVTLEYNWDPSRYYLNHSDMNLAMWDHYHRVFQDYSLHLRDDWRDLQVEPKPKSTLDLSINDINFWPLPFDPDKYISQPHSRCRNMNSQLADNQEIRV